MQLANLMHEIKFFDGPCLLEQLGEFQGSEHVADSVLAAERAGARGCLFATRGLTKYVYGQVVPALLAAERSLSTPALVRAAFLNFSARDAVVGSTVLVVGALGGSDCRALSFAKRSVEVAVCPYPGWAKGSLPMASELIDLIVCAVDADRLASVLRPASVSALYLQVTGNTAADLTVIKSLAGVFMSNATIILHGDLELVESVNDALRANPSVKLWAQAFAPTTPRDDTVGDLFSYYEIVQDLKFPAIPNARRKTETRGLQAGEPARAASRGPYRYLTRSDIPVAADEVIRFADERVVSIPDPDYIRGAENTEAIWTGQFGVQPGEWMYPGQITCPALEVCRFDHLRVVGTGGFITRNDELFEGSMRLFTEDMFVSWAGVCRTDVTRSIDGRLYSERGGHVEQFVTGPTLMMTDSGLPMHYHYLFDFLPRLCFRENITLKDCKIAVPDTALPDQIDILVDYYGVRNEQIVVYSVGGGACLFERAYIAPTLVSDQWAMPEVVLPRTALVHARPPEDARFRNLKRLYISRRDSRDARRLVNEDALVARLETHGFVEIFPGDFSYDQEMHLFQNAEIVVGAFGSGMANLMFCSPGAHVMLLQPDATNWRILSFAMGYLGLSYGYVFGESFRRVERLHNTEWLVDIDVVERELAGVVSRRALRW